MVLIYSYPVWIDNRQIEVFARWPPDTDPMVVCDLEHMHRDVRLISDREPQRALASQCILLEKECKTLGTA